MTIRRGGNPRNSDRPSEPRLPMAHRIGAEPPRPPESAAAPSTGGPERPLWGEGTAAVPDAAPTTGRPDVTLPDDAPARPAAPLPIAPGPAPAAPREARRAGGRGLGLSLRSGQPVRSPGTISGAELARRRGQGRGFSLVLMLLFMAIFAVVVVVVFLTVLRPVVRGIVVGFAGANPSMLKVDWIGGMVKEDLGPLMTAPAGTDSTEITVEIAQGDSPAVIAQKLVDAHVLKDVRAFLLVTIDQKLDEKFKAGTFTVQATMSPSQLASAMLVVEDPHTVLQIRSGLRLEQLATLIQQKPKDTRGFGPLTMSAQDFLDEVRQPPATLLKDYPWVVIPKGGTLEGYLAAGSYRVLPSITADELVRLMLDKFRSDVGAARMDGPAPQGLTWYQVLTLASLVEREAAVNSERPLIAGVYLNRLDPQKWQLGRMQADPTVIYGLDTVNLRQRELAQWPEYSFWQRPGRPMASIDLPSDILGFQTYTQQGLMPAPICTPTVASIDAVLNPNTKAGYFYFVLIPDTNPGTHAFAKTAAEHQKNLKKYGYTR